jgi:hypothetical protein
VGVGSALSLQAAFVIIITLLATTPRAEMHSGNYVFTTIQNGSGYSSNGLAVMLGLLSVQWTMTGGLPLRPLVLFIVHKSSVPFHLHTWLTHADYDAAAHISEEVHRAAIAAPVAIFVAVLNTGMIGWILNIVVVICSGDTTLLPGPSGNSFLGIMYLRMGRAGSITIWAFVWCVYYCCLGPYSLTIRTAPAAC